VVSGLAAGIDTAAHLGAIEGGGRTIAVFGTGIDIVYPAQNGELAAQVALSGACVSQFWPTMRGARWTFPARNLVTSGLSIGTVVVEASETSGARLQAMAALDHGKRVLLLRRLAEGQPWAIEAATRPGVIVVDSVDEVNDAVDLELRVDTAAAL
jgi:DNA processing protein